MKSLGKRIRRADRMKVRITLTLLLSIILIMIIAIESSAYVAIFSITIISYCDESFVAHRSFVTG